MQAIEAIGVEDWTRAVRERRDHERRALVTIEEPAREAQITTPGQHLAHSSRTKAEAYRNCGPPKL